jgi:hypothetical protein
MKKLNKKVILYISIALGVLLLGFGIYIFANNTKKELTTTPEQCSILAISDIKSSLGDLATNIETGVAGSEEKGTSDQSQKYCEYKIGEVSGNSLKFILRLRDFEAKYTSKGHYDLVEPGISVDKSTKIGDGTTFTQFVSAKITNSSLTVYKFETSARAFEFSLDTATDGSVKSNEVKALLVDLANKVNFDNHLI